MPRRELMSWDGDPNYRWVKMYKGVRYRVTCEELRAVARTKEGSVSLANAWWLKKRAEIDATPSESIIIFDEGQHLSRLVQETHQGQQATRELQSLLPEPDVSTVRGVRQVAEAVVGLGDIKNEEERGRVLSAVLGEAVPEAAKEKCRTLSVNGGNFLAVVRESMKPRSIQELRDYIISLNNVPRLLAGEMDIGLIDEALVDRMYLHLRGSKLSSGAKKKRWGFFRPFVKFMWERRLFEMPRNLASHKFEVSAKPIKTYEISEVRKVILSPKPRLKLYALLGLNTSMTQVDMRALKKDQVDLKKGTLTRKRVKTGDNQNVPTVTYPLWPDKRR